uniref:Lipoprotein n=1 Tax=Ascaris lumbricoides TaxID=6252 RepID=A0A0M3HII3_ASCLU
MAGFWPTVAQSYGWQISDEAGSERQYRFEVIEDPSTTLFTGEYGRLGAFEKQRP